MSRRVATIVVLGLSGLSAGCSGRGARVAAELEFDGAGNLVASKAAGGPKISFHYDSRGLRTSVDSSDGSSRFEYDAHGNRIRVRDNAGGTEYYYDAFDRLSAAIWDRGPRRLIAYDRDHTGLISRVSVYDLASLGHLPDYSAQVAALAASAPSGSNGWHQREREVLTLVEHLRTDGAIGATHCVANDISYVRNLRGDLLEIRSPMGSVTFVRPDGGRRIERVLPNGVRSIFEYTPSGLVSGVRHIDSTGREIADFAYDYGPSGQLVDVSWREGDSKSKTTYSWDTRGRLAEMATSGGARFRYSYDEAKRRLTVTNGGRRVAFLFDSLGRISKAQGVALTVNPAGALAASPAYNETTEIVYTGRNLVSEIRTKNSRLNYTWDGEGNLVSRTENGKIAYFVPAAGTGIRLPILEFGADGAQESMLLAGQSVLGRIRAGVPEYYLESASQEAGFIVGERGVGERGLTLGRSNRGGPRPQLIPAAYPIPAGSVPARIGTEPLSAAILPAASAPAEPPDLSDIQWNAFWNGYIASMTAFRWDSRADLETTDRAAAYNWNHGGLGGKVLGGFEALTTAFGGGVLTAGQELGEAWGRLLSVQNDANRWAAATASAKAVLEVLPFTKFDAVGDAIKFGLEKTLAQPLAAEYVRVLFEDRIAPNLDSLIEGQTIQALNRQAAAASRLMAKGFIDNVWETGNTVGEMVEKTLEANEKLQSGRNTGPGVGGIELSSTAQVLGDIGSLRGAVYDTASGSVVLLTGKNDATIPGLKAEDFAVALRLAYSQSPREAAFSLDPADPRNPEGPWLRKVYYPADTLAGTAFGRAMFEADWILKQYSFGVVAETGPEQGKEQRMRTSSVPAYRSVAALSLAKEYKANRGATMSRFWIVAGEMKIRRDGSAIVFDKAAMGVKTKRQVRDPNSKTGLRDDDSVRDPIHEEFAGRFTEHYDELAAEAPELERVRDLAKAVAIAKWLRQSGFPAEPGAMRPDSAALRSADPEPYRPVAALSTKVEQVRTKAIREGNRQGVETLTREVHLFGGVDLESAPRYVPDPGVAQLRNAVQKKLAQSAEPRFDLDFEGQSLTGTVVPLTPAAEDRAPSATLVRDGVVYRMDPRGEAIEAIDKSGDRARYRDAAAGPGGGVEITGKGGWNAVAQTRGDGTFLRIATARGSEIDVTTDAAGAVQKIDVDGKAWAEYYSIGKTRFMRLDQGEYVEVLTYGDTGRIAGRRIERLCPSGQSGENPHGTVPCTAERPGGLSSPAGKRVAEVATVDYAPDGLPTRLCGTDMPDIRWQYDSARRLTAVGSSTGTNVTVTYNDAEHRATWETWSAADNGRQGSPARKLVYENNRLVRSESYRTGTTEYSYADGRLASVKGDRLRETHFSYDRGGRPAIVNLPNGAQLRYRFADRGKTLPSRPASYTLQVMGAL